MPIIQDDGEGAPKDEHAKSIEDESRPVDEKSQGQLWTKHLQWTNLSLCKFLFIEIMLKNNGCITLALPLTFLGF